MFFSTLNSIYQVDPEKQLIRRVNGIENPTPRQGEDGVWKPYVSLLGLSIGSSCMIVWGSDDERLVLKTTMTSPITAILGLAEVNKAPEWAEEEG